MASTPPSTKRWATADSLHDALAEVHSRAIRGDFATVEDVPKLVEVHLRTRYAYPQLQERLEEAARRVLSDYIRDNAKDFDKIEFSEKSIEISLGDGVSVVGRIDLVRRLDTQETTIIDLKSKARAQAEDVTEAQLHIYALGYELLTGRHADYVETYHLEERKGLAARRGRRLHRGREDQSEARRQVPARVSPAAQTVPEALRPVRLPSPLQFGQAGAPTRTCGESVINQVLFDILLSVLPGIRNSTDASPTCFWRPVTAARP